MTADPLCARCGKGFSLSCRMLDCPTNHRAMDLQTVTPLEVLQRLVASLDARIEDGGKMPTYQEWTALARLVRELAGPAAPVVMRGPDPIVATAAGNVVPFRRR